MMKLAMSEEPPWLMKGSVMPVSGMSRLQHDDGGEAHGSERADVGFCSGRRDDAANGEAQIQKQHAGRAEQARLLGDDGEDEVALGDGDAALGYGLTAHAPPDAGAEQVAVGDGIEALH